MDILKAAQAHQDQEFLLRCQYFALKAAVAIVNESEAEPWHAGRLIVAKAILMAPGPWAQRFALTVMTNPTLLAATDFVDVKDSDLEFAIVSVFNCFLQ